MHNTILLYPCILMYRVVWVVFIFISFPVNPRLCAAISNLRSNKGGNSKAKVLLSLRRQLYVNSVEKVIYGIVVFAGKLSKIL
jgi:hypothetical protein